MRQMTKATLRSSQLTRISVMMFPIGTNVPSVKLPRRNSVGCGENVPCYAFPVVYRFGHGRLICDARMRSKKTTSAGQVDEHHSFSGACSRLFFGGQGNKRFRGDAARSSLLSRENRRPLLSRNAIALPPLGYGWLAHGHVGREVLQGGPQADDISERAKFSHTRSLRTIGP